MEQTYTIDKSKIEQIRKRSFFRGLKILGFTFLGMVILMFPQREFYFQSATLYGYLFGLLISIGAVYVGSGKVKRIYDSLEITLSEGGVKQTAEMSPYKSILWINMSIKEKKNGAIVLTDNTILKINRWWTGAGMIIIQPEINNRQTLLLELIKHSNR